MDNTPCRKVIFQSNAYKIKFKSNIFTWNRALGAFDFRTI